MEQFRYVAQFRTHFVAAWIHGRRDVMKARRPLSFRDGHVSCAIFRGFDFAFRSLPVAVGSRQEGSECPDCRNHEGGSRGKKEARAPSHLPCDAGRCGRASPVISASWTPGEKQALSFDPNVLARGVGVGADKAARKEESGKQRERIQLILDSIVAYFHEMGTITAIRCAIIHEVFPKGAISRARATKSHNGQDDASLTGANTQSILQ